MTIIVKLSNELKYDKKGEPNHKTFELELIAPSRDDRKFCRKLKQRVSRGLTNAVAQMGGKQEEPKPGDEGKMPTGEEIMAILGSCDPSILDFGDFCEKMETELLPFIIVDKDIPLNATLSKQIDADDWEMIIGTWIVNFTLDSQTEKVGKP